MSSRSVRFQWPPVPCVEEEPASLARELHGLSKLSEKPGVEGTCRRGTVDQYPVILAPDSPLPTSTTPPSDLATPGLGNVSSDDSSSGLRTPSPQVPEPAVRSRTQSKDPFGLPPSSVSSRSRSRAPQAPPQLPVSDQQPPRQRRPQSPARDRGSGRGELGYFPPDATRGLPIQQGPKDRDFHLTKLPASQAPALSPLGRSNSVRTGNVTAPTAPVRQRSEPHPGHVTAPTAPIRQRSEPHPGHVTAPTAPIRQRSEPHPGHITAPTAPIRQRSEPHPGHITAPTAPIRQHSEPHPGHQPESSAPRGRSYSLVTSPPAPISSSQLQVKRVADAPTLSERIEEKLRLRHELRELGSDSDSEAPRRSRAKSISPKILPVAPAPEVCPPPRELSRAPGQHSMPPTKEPIKVLVTPQEPKQLPSAMRGRAATMVTPAPPALRSSSRAPSTMVSRSMSSDEAQPSSSRPRRANSVKFQDPMPRHSAPAPAPTQKASSPQRSTGLCVTPCPRSLPVAGLQDWYTLKGLTHLDICPSCMSQIGHSRFREFFIPSLAKPATQKTRCAFANAWTRLAWTQMIKKQHASLEMLYQMTRPPPGNQPCPGRVVADQTWYRVVDPETGKYLPRFHVCGSCARNVRILMPSQRDTFEHCPDVQERMCDFVTTSPRFVQYVDLLDIAAARTEPSRQPDSREFISYARRKVVLRDCRRDRPTMGTWHYIPSLPEFSVCEDCYDEVVWPLAKTHHPIAKSFSTSMHFLPGDSSSRCREASCQLYSPRMRTKFREAVAKNEFSGLKAVALRRFEAERRFRDRREELLDAENRGYDCEAELRKAIEEWRKWE
ncbi:uncharacterized protein N7503_005477 [Penicillium pulvis]|uniref:uncharacterized protein n=1 Tax=Penicillium pulvis TaxID=1562058 RepID=UPI0025468FFE|nr:uncharacterized protein N7503_005477 [Penicillium pulvis]KAJ5803027.1 hypothetical protein N7503_005477 [Penicillium pulvis]